MKKAKAKGWKELKNKRVKHQPPTHIVITTMDGSEVFAKLITDYRPVKMKSHPQHEFICHRDHNEPSWYVVSERSTGLVVPSSKAGTVKTAVTDADQCLARKTPAELRKLIKKMTKRVTEVIDDAYQRQATL